MSASLVHLLAALAASATVLVFVLRYDERFDATLDRDYHWLYPTLDRTLSAIKIMVRQGVLALLLAFATPFLWRFLQEPLGLPALGPGGAEAARYIEEAGRGRVSESPAALFARTPFLQYAAFAWVGALFIYDAVRALSAPLYDMFISYKSEDAPLARRIADALTAAGWRVWFAEQQVLLAWRWLFPLAILDGVRNARFGLVISNDRWANSKHCAFEARKLLGLLGPRHVLELRAPRQPLPHRKFRALARSPASDAADLGAILAFVKQATGAPFPADPPPPAPASGAVYSNLADGRPLSLTTEGWSLHRSGAAAGDPLGGQAWSYDGLPEGQLLANLHWGGETSREGQRLDQGVDDREMFDALLRWAPKHIGRVRAKVRGVHLLFHSGLSQMGVTYWVRVQTVLGPAGPVRVGGYWTRKISLVIPNPESGAMAEFVFTFGFQGAFADYCRYAHIMDALALSLQWR